MILTMPCKKQSGSNQHPTQDKENVPPSGLEQNKNNVELTSVS
jgi:hypothetical protein